jgi:DNA-binding MarR family transcriptional regulator
MADSGLTADDYAVYSAVLRDGPVTVTELARTLGMPLATASDYLRTMTRRGHARRYRNPDDSRSFLVVGTDAGRAAHARARVDFGDMMTRLRAALTIPEDDLVRALDALSAAIATVQHDLEAEDPRRRARPPLPG